MLCPYCVPEKTGSALCKCMIDNSRCVWTRWCPTQNCPTMGNFYIDYGCKKQRKFEKEKGKKK